MFSAALPCKMTFSSHKENEMVVGLQFLVLKKMRKNLHSLQLVNKNVRIAIS